MVFYLKGIGICIKSREMYKVLSVRRMLKLKWIHSSPSIGVQIRYQLVRGTMLFHILLFGHHLHFGQSITLLLRRLAFVGMALCIISQSVYEALLGPLNFHIFLQIGTLGSSKDRLMNGWLLMRISKMEEILIQFK